MKPSQSLAVALGLLVLPAVFCSKPHDSRSVGPVNLAGAVAPAKFTRDAATALFVGVRVFPHDRTLDVPYAVDDAVDLAHRFALDGRVALVPPRRVVLALSGDPQKDESKQRLRELREAGARIVRRATAGDILHLAKEQAARAGREGLFVLSIASHGFQQKGEAYILGSTSAFGAPETAVPTAVMLDVAGQAARSLVFIDACRDRVGQTRGATPDPAAAAPLIRRMGRIQGQVIFYAAAAGHYAFDDHIRRNGVFTRAVLDGLACEASSPRGTVVAETLHTFVEREVRHWILENRNVTVSPATQVSMEGDTRNMPLSQCWLTPSAHVRVSFDGSTVRAYGDDSRPLWRKDFGEPVVHAMAADLDADAFYEVVVGFRDRLVVFNRDGQPRWTRDGEGMALRTFTTGDLYEKHTSQVVAIWNDSRASRLTVLDSDGRERSRFDYAGGLQHVAIGRPTNMHAPKIVVTTGTSVLLLHAKKLKQRWHRALVSSADTIEAVNILDVDRDNRRDIAVATHSGTTWFDFEGKVVLQSAKGAWKDATMR